MLAGAINGRISEAQFLGVYVNQSGRMNWAGGFSQSPQYFYGGSDWTRIENPANPGDSIDVYSSRTRRFVTRDAFQEGYYPFDRFNRIEFGMHVINVAEATLSFQTLYNATTGEYIDQRLVSGGGPTATYIQPTIAHVHDNTLFGYVGPFAGSRSRFSIAPAFGSWRFLSGLADVRRYMFVRPFTLSARALVFGRYGRDADRFPIFAGNTELLRGYTAGSMRSHECVENLTNPALQYDCPQLDQLIGSKVASASVELRFPLARTLVLGFLPVGFPPIEGAVFYDIAMAWNDSSIVKWDRKAWEDPVRVRTPLRSWGVSIRANMLGLMILRADYSKPLDRPYRKAYWTLSLGPTF